MKIAVSIPHRKFKNIPEKDEELQETKVSIPHRKFKNVDFKKNIRSPCLVSIPHRKFKNEGRHCRKDRALRVSIPHRKFKNIDPLWKDSNFAEFPSLIGSSKTLRRFSIARSTNSVSIPHRKFKNRCLGQGQQGLQLVSIPHRKFKNDIYLIVLLVYDRGFHPS